MTNENVENRDPVTRRNAIAIVGTASAAGMLSMGTACESLKEMLSSSETPEADAGSVSFDGAVHGAEDPHWDALVGQEFRVHGTTFVDEGAGAGATLVLLESLGRDHSEDPGRPDQLRDKSVSLLFASTSRGTRLPSGTYTIENEGFGRFPLFLHHCPRDHDHGSANVYEAVLN